MPALPAAQPPSPPAVPHEQGALAQSVLADDGGLASERAQPAMPPLDEPPSASDAQAPTKPPPGWYTREGAPCYWDGSAWMVPANPAAVAPAEALLAAPMDSPAPSVTRNLNHPIPRALRMPGKKLLVVGVVALLAVGGGSEVLLANHSKSAPACTGSVSACRVPPVIAGEATGGKVASISDQEGLANGNFARYCVDDLNVASQHVYSTAGAQPDQFPSVALAVASQGHPNRPEMADAHGIYNTEMQIAGAQVARNMQQQGFWGPDTQPRIGEAAAFSQLTAPTCNRLLPENAASTPAPPTPAPAAASGKDFTAWNHLTHPGLTDHCQIPGHSAATEVSSVQTAPISGQNLTFVFVSCVANHFGVVEVYPSTTPPAALAATLLTPLDFATSATITPLEGGVQISGRASLSTYYRNYAYSGGKFTLVKSG
jgi:hypothetical protein